MKSLRDKKRKTFFEKPLLFGCGRRGLFFLHSSFIVVLAVTSAMGCTVRLKGLSDSSDSASTGTTSTGPTVAISAPSSTTVIETSGTVTFTVTTTGSTSVSLTSAQVTLNTTGGASCTKSVTNGTTTSATVTLSNCSGVGGTVSISIAAGIASNATGDLSSAVGPSATVTVVNSAFTQTWPFDALSEASYSFDTSKMNFTGGVCRLTGSDQIDDGNTASGFLASGSGGTAVHTGTSWDSTNNYVRLTQTGSPTNNAELDQSWTPEWSSLTAYWKMNNDWNDSKGTNNGTATNATFTTTSKMGSHAGSFANNGYVEVPDHASLEPGTEMTVAAWIKPTATDQEDIILDKYAQAADSQYIFSVFSDQRLVHAWHTTGGDAWGTTAHNNVKSTGTVPLNAWSHAVMVRSGSTVSFYINGVSAGSSSPADANPYRAGAQTLRIGGEGRGGVNRYFQGSIDEIALWTKALTATQIQTLYSRQSAKYAGTLTSRVMDAFQTGMSWTTLSWVPTLPFLKELTDYASGSLQNESSTDYSSLVGSTGATSDNDLMSSLAALYHMNGSGSLANGASLTDESGNARTGTIYNGNGTGLTYSTGKLGTALYFDGVDDEIDIASGLNPWGGDFSFSLWAYPTSKSAVQHNVLAVGSNATNGFRFGIASSDRWRYWTTESGGTVVIGDATVSPPSLYTWQHLSITYKSSTGTTKMYVNGVEVASSTGTYVAPGAGASIGKYGGYMFAGYLDEVAIWGRTLHATEVKQLYRRGANRIKHQVRICTASDCSDDSTGANWKGPDGTNQTYFSELNNNSTPLAMTGDVKKTLPSMLFSDFTSPVGTSRYFQYRTILESDDTSTSCNYGSGATWCSPELKSVTVDPTHYDSSSPTIIGKTGASYASLATFTQTLGSSCASGIGYNLGVGASSAAATWYWWDSAANAGAGGWVAADGTVAKSNTAATINTNAATFGTQVGTGTVYFKAFLKSSGSSACELDRLQLTGQQ